MRKFGALVIFFATAWFLFGHGNEDRTSKITVSGKSIEVDYGSPHLGERDIASMIRPGMIWRMGADRTTRLTTEALLSFGGTTIAAGSYGLLARNISETEWELLINSDPGVRSSSHDPEKDVAVVPLTLAGMDEPIEHMAIELIDLGENQIEFALFWGTMRLSTRFGVVTG